MPRGVYLGKEVATGYAPHSWWRERAVFTAAGWAAFTAGVRAVEFD